MSYDAILLVSFGGPEGPDDVLPFLENVLRGRNVPRARLLEVAGHYQNFGGKSPLNDQNRALIRALEAELAARGPRLPVYWGNRNWHPLLPDTLRRMAADGVRRALAFVTSAFSSYSGCRQYREDIARAREKVGTDAPEIEKLRLFYNHPGFLEPVVEHCRLAFARISPEQRPETRLVFTAHSIPVSMAKTSRYEEQLREACRLVAAALPHRDWLLVYQSRSGPPAQPWLEPDISAALRALHAAGIRNVVVSPIGFISEHIEVLYDLDTEARRISDELGLNMVRAATVGAHPRFVAMIRELLLERIEGAAPLALGSHGPAPDACSPDCCR